MGTGRYDFGGRQFPGGSGLRVRVKGPNLHADRRIRMATARSRPPKPRPRSARQAQARQPGTVRLVVADSQAIDRGGMVGLLEDERDFEVIGEAATVDETIRQCAALHPDVLVLSLNLPGQDLGAAIPAIRGHLPRLRIVALSERGAINCLVLNPPYRKQTAADLNLICELGVDCLHLAATQGAMATVRRSADPEELFRAIRTVAEGGASYDPTTATGILAQSVPNGAAPAALSLTQQELKVAAHIAEGLSNKEISTALEISEATVKKHVGHLLTKLGTADRLQAGLLLARNPLIFRR
jgi:DNA-binding NarL/FixJ family response regulator